MQFLPYLFFGFLTWNLPFCSLDSAAAAFLYIGYKAVWSKITEVPGKQTSVYCSFSLVTYLSNIPWAKEQCLLLQVKQGQKYHHPEHVHIPARWDFNLCSFRLDPTWTYRKLPICIPTACSQWWEPDSDVEGKRRKRTWDSIFLLLIC